MAVWSLPDCLVVHLKRFRDVAGWRDKIEAHVDFPLQVRQLYFSVWVHWTDDTQGQCEGNFLVHLLRTL